MNNGLLEMIKNNKLSIIWNSELNSVQDRLLQVGLASKDIDTGGIFKCGNDESEPRVS